MSCLSPTGWSQTLKELYFTQAFGLTSLFLPGKEFLNLTAENFVSSFDSSELFQLVGTLWLRPFSHVTCVCVATQESSLASDEDLFHFFNGFLNLPVNESHTCSVFVKQFLNLFL